MTIHPAIAATMPEKARKYRNQKPEIDGIVFDSKAEARRWQTLRLAEKAGEIRDLRRQVRYDLTVNGVKVSRYTADFVYADVASGKEIVEDVKSPATKTRAYVMRRKLMKACHGIEITEVA